MENTEQPKTDVAPDVASEPERTAIERVRSAVTDALQRQFKLFTDQADLCDAVLMHAALVEWNGVCTPDGPVLPDVFSSILGRDTAEVSVW